MNKIITVNYRSRPGHCKWKLYSIMGINYHIAIPITKWVFKVEKPKMWVYFGKNVF